jgi:hypothetical protein
VTPDSSAAGVAHALSVIRTRFEQAANPDDVMAFHNVEHTEGVVRRTEVLLRAMGASPHEIELGRLAAAFHDVVQRWVENPLPDGKLLRKRLAGQNEAESADEAVAWMRAHGWTDAHHADLVRAAILSTVPSWDVQNSTVAQPNLLPDSPPVVRAVALADLGIPGMESGAEFVETGDGLFREENLDVARALRHCSRRADVPADLLESYKARAVGWCRGQVSYARGRQARLAAELGHLTGAARSAVEALFGHFAESAAAAEEAVRRREAASAWDVLKATGYAVPA